MDIETDFSSSIVMNIFILFAIPVHLDCFSIEFRKFELNWGQRISGWNLHLFRIGKNYFKLKIKIVFHMLEDIPAFSFPSIHKNVMKDFYFVPSELGSTLNQSLSSALLISTYLINAISSSFSLPSHSLSLMGYSYRKS
jgi:hypothetical protein